MNNEVLFETFQDLELNSLINKIVDVDDKRNTDTTPKVKKKYTAINTLEEMNQMILELNNSPIISFDLIANKFDESISSSNLKRNKWVLESNLETEQKELLNNK